MMVLRAKYREISISGFIAIFGQYMCGIIHESGHALACEYFDLDYEILIWGTWGVNHDPNFIVWVTGGGFTVIILSIILFVHRNNKSVKAGIFPLLFFQLITSFLEGFFHKEYLNNIFRMKYVYYILFFIFMFIFYVKPKYDKKKVNDK